MTNKLLLLLGLLLVPSVVMSKSSAKLRQTIFKPAKTKKRTALTWLVGVVVVGSVWFYRDSLCTIFKSAKSKKLDGDLSGEHISSFSNKPTRKCKTPIIANRQPSPSVSKVTWQWDDTISLKDSLEKKHLPDSDSQQEFGFEQEDYSKYPEFNYNNILAKEVISIHSRDRHKTFSDDENLEKSMHSPHFKQKNKKRTRSHTLSRKNSGSHEQNFIPYSLSYNPNPENPTNENMDGDNNNPKNNHIVSNQYDSDTDDEIDNFNLGTDDIIFDDDINNRYQSTELPTDDESSLNVDIDDIILD